jgi:putative endonuclease
VPTPFHVYILASKRNGTLYIGVTNDLVRRVYEHKESFILGFTKEYGVHRLVYFEEFGDPTTAIQREKNLKHWVRRWKIELIEKANPTWRDLYDDIISG